MKRKKKKDNKNPKAARDGRRGNIRKEKPFKRYITSTDKDDQKEPALKK